MTCQPVPNLVKFWIYALQGIFYEIGFTAAWAFAEKGSFTLMGETSIWSVFVYGGGGIICEYLLTRNIITYNFITRTMCYLMYTYVWEYITGAFLSLFGACPWDYTERRWNLHGLITLEYAPAWIFAGILHEKLVLLVNTVCWCDTKPGLLANGKKDC